MVVSKPEYAEALWNNGYFGVGNLSSSGMNYDANSLIVNEERLQRKISWNEEIKDDLKDEDCTVKPDEEDRTLLVVNLDKEKYSAGPPVKLVPDPYYLKEKLILAKEEALFLSYALGCLIVSNSEGREMDIDMMWNTFMEDDEKFFIRYVVYHHFRTKGWVVKPGTKFGTDWILYPVGPPFYHSQFLVVSRCSWADTMKCDVTQNEPLSWTDLSAFERLSNQVGKVNSLLYMYTKV